MYKINHPIFWLYTSLHIVIYGLLKVHWLKVKSKKELELQSEQLYKQYLQKVDFRNKKEQKYAMRIHNFRAYLIKDTHPITWRCPDLKCNGILERINASSGECLSCHTAFNKSDVVKTFIWPKIKGMFFNYIVLNVLYFFR